VLYTMYLSSGINQFIRGNRMIVMVLAVIFIVICARQWSTMSGTNIMRSGHPRDPCENSRFVEREVHEGEGDLVLVTGGSGFIGSNLVEELLRLNYRVRILDNIETGNLMYMDLSQKNFEFMFGDIEKREDVARAMVGVKGVFHLAALSKVTPSLKDPKMATYNVRVNAVGTANVLEVANSTKIVTKVVYAASSTYYGRSPVPNVETDPFLPTSPYAASKYMGELQTMTYDVLYNMPTVNLRFFTVFGPRQPRSGAYAIVTGIFIDQMRTGQPLTIDGEGDHFRDFIHVKDIVRGLILAYQNTELRGVSINMGTGKTITVKEVADMVSPNQVHREERAQDVEGTLASTCRMKHMLGFKHRYDFVSETLKMIKDKDNEFIPDYWSHHDVEAYLVSLVPGWTGMRVEHKNAALREKLKSNGLDVLENLPQIRSRIVRQSA